MKNLNRFRQPILLFGLFLLMVLTSAFSYGQNIYTQPDKTVYLTEKITGFGDRVSRNIAEESFVRLLRGEKTYPSYSLTKADVKIIATAMISGQRIEGVIESYPVDSYFRMQLMKLTLAEDTKQLFLDLSETKLDRRANIYLDCFLVTFGLAQVFKKAGLDRLYQLAIERAQINFLRMPRYLEGGFFPTDVTTAPRRLFIANQLGIALATHFQDSRIWSDLLPVDHADSEKRKAWNERVEYLRSQFFVGANRIGLVGSVVSATLGPILLFGFSLAMNVTPETAVYMIENGVWFSLATTVFITAIENFRHRLQFSSLKGMLSAVHKARETPLPAPADSGCRDLFVWL